MGTYKPSPSIRGTYLISPKEKESKMEGGAEYFKEPMPCHYHLEGDIDGVKFTVKGEAVGNASTGVIKGKYVCTTGVLPTSWVSLIKTLSYGSKCFTRYPNGIKDFFKSCFPDGYTQDRTIQFEGDGVYKTHQEITLKDGAIHNNATLKGEGFKADGNILGNKLAHISPGISYVIPNGEGIKVIDHRIHPLKDGGYQLEETTQFNNPLKPCSGQVPKYHYLYNQVELSRDAADSSDHIIIEEKVKA